MKYTEEDKVNIINDYSNDVKLIDIGAKYNVSGDVIAYYLKKWGIPTRDRRKYKFTDEDILFLKREYPKGNWNTITDRFPNVPKGAIYGLMSTCNIGMDAYFWSEHDKMILKQYYGELSVKKIQSMLQDKYPIKLIQNQAKKMGLTKSREWTKKEIDILYQYYETMSRAEIQELLPNKSINAIGLKATSLGLISGWAREHVYTEEEDCYIIDNWENMSDEEISNALGRTLHSIKDRRRVLGLLHECGKSGYTTLTMYIRKNIAQWKKDSMQACGYKCILTNDVFDEIHHIYSFRLILNEVLKNLQIDDRASIDDYTTEELQSVLKEFLLIQSLHPLGVCLRKDVHRLYHHIYGYGGNTEEQWNEFVEDFKKGKYVNVINN